ncbi:MAG: hypothetical protein JWM12_1237, partial [Ilumatobacteraceae bacterium]|nr:hypothetical protein [Ilumatobacteraceae bacterium]
ALAELRLPTPDSPVPTLRMLATMSAGLPNDDPWADRQESLTDDEFDAVLRPGVRFAWVPGTEFEYSNLGYALLGRALQVAGGRRFHDLVDDEIIAPLGLTATSFTADVSALGGVAIGHQRVDDEWAPLPFSGSGAFSPIGGLFSTVADLVTWVQWFVDAHHGDAQRSRRGAPSSPLSTASRREMQQAHRLIPPPPDSGTTRQTATGYGFGLVVEHDAEHGTIVSHSGGYPGFSAHMRWHPASGLGIVALENATYAGVAKPTSEAMRGLLDAVAPTPAWGPWPETLAAQATVTELLSTWDDAAATNVLGDDTVFSDNVGLDEPLVRRRAHIGAAVARAGRLGAIDEARSEGPNDREWRIHGELADLRCELTMNPLEPPQIQTLEVRLDGAAAAATTD